MTNINYECTARLRLMERYFPRGATVTLNPSLMKYITYGQDFRFNHRGTPRLADHIWTVRALLGNGLVSLLTDGYGGRPYGSGVISINWIDLAIVSNTVCGEAA